MLKKIFENKKLFILVMTLIVIIVGIVIAVVINHGPKEHDKINLGIETEQGNDKLEDETKNDTEVGIENAIGSPADSIDGSGSWDAASDSNSMEKQEDKIGDNNNQEENDETISDENVLIDDKEWGYIN